MTEPTDQPDSEPSELQSALAAVERAIEQVESGNSDERSALQAELNELRDLADKLRNQRVEVAVFGEISTGKSALINALAGRQEACENVSVRGGWTKEVWRLEWEGGHGEATGTILPGLENSQLVLVDTPGLNEVEGEARANMARDAAERSDVVLFVTDSDLNETEHNALAEIASLHKPIVLVLNKVDLYRPDDLQALEESLHKPRVADLVGGPKNIIKASADPREKEYFLEQASGGTKSEWRKPEPQVEEVRARVLELLADEGKALVALSAAMYAADRTDRVSALRVQMRSTSADRVIWSYAVAKAIGVSLMPWPVADVGSGMAIDVAMVVTLGQVYGIPITSANAKELVVSIFKAAGWMIVGEAMVHVGSSLAKALSLGSSTLFTALPQGAAAGYGSYLVGQAARYYFEQGGSWGDLGPKQTVTKILENTDKQSVVDRLKGEIKKKIASNRHGR